MVTHQPHSIAACPDGCTNCANNGDYLQAKPKRCSRQKKREWERGNGRLRERSNANALMEAFVVCAANDDNSPPLEQHPCPSSRHPPLLTPATFISLAFQLTPHLLASPSLTTTPPMRLLIARTTRRLLCFALLHATTCNNIQRATCVYCNFIKCKIVTAKIATTTTARTVVHKAHSAAIRAENYYGLQCDPPPPTPLSLFLSHSSCLSLCRQLLRPG